jgi:hypothetical protein
MKKIPMVVIEEPKHNTRSVMVRGGKLGPIFSGKGSITYVCGKCAFPLAENMDMDQISSIVFKCPSCGAFNDWSPSSSAKN